MVISEKKGSSYSRWNYQTPAFDAPDSHQEVADFLSKTPAPEVLQPVTCLLTLLSQVSQEANFHAFCMALMPSLGQEGRQEEGQEEDCQERGEVQESCLLQARIEGQEVPDEQRHLVHGGPG